MIRALRALGVRIDGEPSAGPITVHGGGGDWPTRHADMFVANSGTTMRFLAAMLATGQGTYRLDGVPRMRQRPIGDLIEALRQLGADIAGEGPDGRPPVVLRAADWPAAPRPSRQTSPASFSAGCSWRPPTPRRPVTLRVDGPLVSQPYIRMTVQIMAAFGVEVARDAPQRFHIAAPAHYRGCHYTIEPDASAASYFWAAAAITGGEVTVTGLGMEALQGDVAFCDRLEQMGCHLVREDQQITVRGGRLAESKPI